MRYFVADSFQGYELIGVPYEKSGKLYSKAKAKCDRCIKGVYVTRVNGSAIGVKPYRVKLPLIIMGNVGICGLYMVQAGNLVHDRLQR